MLAELDPAAGQRPGADVDLEADSRARRIRSSSSVQSA